MMDPLAVISLVGNLVQFVELSIKLLKEARTAYKSGVGTTSGVEALREQMERLQALAARAPPPGSDAIGTPDEIALAKLSEETKKLASEVIQLLNKLTAKNMESRLGAVRLAVKAHVRKADLERLEHKVARCRADIIDRLTLMTSERQWSTICLLKSNLEDLSKANDGIGSAVDDTKRALDEAATSIKQRIQHNDATLEGILKSLEKISRISMETKQLDAIMNRLRFDEIYLRELNIADANQYTFRWILHDQSNENRQNPTGSFSTRTDSMAVSSIDGATSIYESRYKSQLRVQKEKRIQTRESFLHWLQFENGVFYISGKPGSGKSTLMKFICSEERMTQKLKAWAANKVLIFARFFFWAAGSEKQKSLEGLYRAILYEVLHTCPEVSKTIFPETWRSCESNPRNGLDDDRFLMVELRAAFERLMTCKEIFQNHKLCIVIDGLDEFNGDFWAIAKSLVAWSQNSDVKICISCRPHNEFEQHFGQKRSRVLRLHEVNGPDMVGLIHDKLFGDERFGAVRDHKDYASFEENLVERSEGVFLWLVVAIKDLLDGLGSSYSLSQLKAKLDTIPDAIENIYRKLLDSISPSDRQLAFRTFLSILELRRSHWKRSAGSDIIFSLLDDLADKDPEHLEIYSGSPGFALTDDEMERRCKAIKMRINKRCKGLLQVIPGGWFKQSQVFEPVHRTLLEYLSQPQTRARLEEGAIRFDPNLSLVLSHIWLAQGLLLGAKYYPWKGTEEVDTKFRHLNLTTSGLPSQIIISIDLISVDSLYLRLIAVLGDVLKQRYSFQNPRQWFGHHGLSPHAWREHIFSAALSVQHDFYEAAFAAFLLQYSKANIERLDLIFSQTSYRSPIVTRNLLLVNSSMVYLRDTRNEPNMTLYMDRLHFLLRRKLDPNVEVPCETVFGYNPDRHGRKKFGTYWTSWTVSLFLAVDLVNCAQPNTYLVEMVKTYLVHGADATVVLVGYLMQECESSGSLNKLKALPDGLASSGPYYIDVLQLLRVWKAVGVEDLTSLMSQVESQCEVSWVSKMRNNFDFWKVQAKHKIEKLDISTLRLKSLVVLTVVPQQRLSDVAIQDLEHLWRALKEGRLLRFLHIF